MTNKKRIFIIFFVYIISLMVSRIVMTYKCLQCSGNMRGIFNHISAYRLDNENKNPVSLEYVESSSEFEDVSFLCPVSRKKYIYFPESDNTGNILLSDSIPTHSVIRKGLIGWLDFFTYRIFSPKGRIVFYSEGVEGFLPELEFREMLEKQNGILSEQAEDNIILLRD